MQVAANLHQGLNAKAAVTLPKRNAVFRRQLDQSFPAPVVQS